MSEAGWCDGGSKGLKDSTNTPKAVSRVKSLLLSIGRDLVAVRLLLQDVSISKARGFVSVRLL